MEIGLAKKEDALRIAQIHKNEIHLGFLSTLHISFLKNLYEAIILSPYSFCVVARDNGAVIGFISGATSIGGLYRYFFKKYFFSSLLPLLKKVGSLSFIKRSIENLLYPVKESDLPPAELLTMAVDRNFQGKGVASTIFADFLSEMRKRNILTFRALVGEELAPAISFYEKNGFIFKRETMLHDKKVSRVYLYNL